MFYKVVFYGGVCWLNPSNAFGSFIKNPIIAPISMYLLLPDMMLNIFSFPFLSFSFHHQNNPIRFVCHYKFPFYRQGLYVLKNLSNFLMEQYLNPGLVESKTHTIHDKLCINIYSLTTQCERGTRDLK